MPAPEPHLAPGALRLVQELVNSVDLASGEDHFNRPEALRAWYVQRNLLDHGAPVAAQDIARVHQLRDSLRALMWVNNGMEPTHGAADMLNRLAAEMSITIRFHPDGRAYLTSTAEGATGALGKVYAIAVNAMAEGTWPRLKACLNEACRWIFYDVSRNSSGTWCSMAVCGNQNKARRYRLRHTLTRPH